ncbi:MAG: right-handed parallel beta-helix repeat-containing protein [Alteromonadaceae bacterium]|nr:right-handed parallel beta-helix repeat-containing protein [Alteromonadaceae bacterium]
MQLIMSKLLQGMIFGIGALIVMGGAGIVGVTQFTNYNLKDILYKIQEKTGTATVVEPFAEPVSVIKDFSKTPRLTVSPDMKVRYASNVQELNEALADANKTGNTVIYLLDGVYNIGRTLNINSENITMMSVSGNPYETVIMGSGHDSGIGNLIRVNRSGFRMDGITLTDASFHTVQVAGELDVDNVHFNRMIFQDAKEQLFKVSHNYNNSPEKTSDNGIVENSIFQYTRGIAYQYYSGGIDAIGATNWQVRNNVFRDISSPSRRIASFAVHFWINSKDNVVADNLFINNDRHIGFGLSHQKKNVKHNHSGGAIRNNVILHAKTTPFADTGIALEQSPKTIIENNFVYLRHRYPRAIEYRFPETTDVVIKNNHTNKHISSRDGGTAELVKNKRKDDEEYYLSVFSQLAEDLNIKRLY